MSRALLAALLAQVNLARIAGGCEPQEDFVPSERKGRSFDSEPSSLDRLFEPRRPRPSGPPSRAREEARRRKQRARAGLPVVEPVAVDEAACVGVEGGGA